MPETESTPWRLSDEDRVAYSKTIPGHLWDPVGRMCECGAEVGVKCDLETVEQHLDAAAAQLAAMTAQHPAAPETERLHVLIDNGEDALQTCTGCDWESWDAAPSFADHIPAAPETETDANGLTGTERSDLFLSLPDDVSGAEERRLYAAVERIVAERVRVVEGERDREAEYARYLQTELDADAKHAALKPGESCDVCTHLESEQVQEWMNSDLDYRDRAESAEAALEAEKADHERLRAGVEALAESATQRAYMEIAVEKMLTVQCVPGDTTRALVPGHWRDAAETLATVSVADLRALLAGGGAL